MRNKSLAILAAAIMTGCVSTPALLTNDGQTSLMEANKVFTQTNLHPDLVRKRLYSINYQQQGLIPRCTEVQLLDISGKKLIFKAGDVTYQYLYHKASGSFDENIKKYFSDSCDTKVVSKLNSIDRKGLTLGKVFKGMSKQGVILAIGYPPLHMTPSLDADTWKYWSNRFNTFDLKFNDKDILTDIID